jgi:hypothetical protein
MDVPTNHWAYDAISQLAARGIIAGYDDGSFRGGSPSTRYELSAVIAKSLAKVDLEKASKQDVDMLRRLILEFKDELDALGVKASSLDERLGVFEQDLGGWSISGVFSFDADFGNDDGFYDQLAGPRNWRGENELETTAYAFFIRKRISDKTSFETWMSAGPRNGSSPNIVYNSYHIKTELPYGIALDVGRIDFLAESDLGFQMGFGGENDQAFGNSLLDAFLLDKSWGSVNLRLLISRMNDEAGIPVPGSSFVRNNVSLEQYYLGARADFQFNERIRAGILAYYLTPDNEIENVNGSGIESDTDLLTLGVFANYSIRPGLELRGIYYNQNQGDSFKLDGSTEANLWRIIADINQDVLKYTSLRLEYGQWDNNFVRYGYGFSFTGADFLYNTPQNANTGTIWGIRAEQRWGERWSTLERYFKADFNTRGYDDTSSATLAVTYYLNPAVSFQLAYDAIDYGSGNPSGTHNGDDSIIRLRTTVSF